MTSSPRGHGGPNRTPDEELEKVVRFLSQPEPLRQLVAAVRRALDEVIATGRTGRWNLDQCNDQEKAYVGVNLENVIRADLDLPPHRPRRPDFEIDGVEVDCKWSRNWGGWQIPREAVGVICLLLYGDDLEDEVAIGLVRPEEGLLVGGNQDKKRTIKRPEGLATVRWLQPRGAGLPPNFLMNLRKQDRDAILSPRGGDERARQLFKRCDGMIVHRQTIESIGQQVDDARRSRGETREALKTEGFEVLNGHWKKDQARAVELGGPVPKGSAQWVSLRSDGTSLLRREASEPQRRTEAAAFRRQMKQELKAARFSRKLKEEEWQLLDRIEEQEKELTNATLEAVESAEFAAMETAEQLTLETD